MATIALIGPDGAGKTTITNMLRESEPLRLKHLYMGINVSSSNRVLPTSRLVENVKMRMGSRLSQRVPGPGDADGSNVKRRRGPVWATARLVNHLAEEWYRQLLSWYYQLRGFTVLYDRHFALDFAAAMSVGQPQTFDKRLHRWFLKHLYPRPDLVIFLDAPGEVLYARKGESTIVELERRRQAYLRQGGALPGFVRVDATQPLPEVYAEVARHVRRVSAVQTAAPAARRIAQRPEREQ